MNCDPAEEKRIFLIGYRGTGKTTTGRILAEMLGYAFLDTDQMVEKKCAMSISRIVEQKGWDFFRKMEKQVLLTALDAENCVIATGGGIVIDPENILFVKSSGVVVWLSAPVAVIVSRIAGDMKSADTRPSFTDKDIEEETCFVLGQRSPLYRQAADFEINTSLDNAANMAEKIKRRIYGR
ncbi:MAG: shikimate kinase AroL [Thermodesulfobacteriota bacterium]|nr:shikimate kinase AroL [Thermodesulfobacteriota bacterium]